MITNNNYNSIINVLNFLFSAVGFIFIFSPLLMLLTTITFTVGAPLEKFLCQPIKDPKLTTVNKVSYLINVQIYFATHKPLSFGSIVQKLVFSSVQISTWARLLNNV